MLVIIESPFAGDVEKNIEYARKCMLDSLSRGEFPFASHLLYPQVLDDKNPNERALGIHGGYRWMMAADLVAVYEDLGISDGMQRAIDHAQKYDIRVVHRTLLDIPRAGEIIRMKP